jgi:hypothetical protein
VVVSPDEMPLESVAAGLAELEWEDGVFVTQVPMPEEIARQARLEALRECEAHVCTCETVGHGKKCPARVIAEEIAAAEKVEKK